eukprot:CAMPEP_0174706328 /NCGR_PEP_ID=MMETSP1094-20130205/9223_1 /TAXON_ID=156173 /ORGANISM="Chrysochromulina brevifilum, Strain UTEX LB 985" /LENGTH=65 /DNA_ID=CAMNT_0015904583 /DNA_START=67 /DNA_END=267 /DNA_ORIENTATION=+
MGKTGQEGDRGDRGYCGRRSSRCERGQPLFCTFSSEMQLQLWDAPAALRCTCSSEMESDDDMPGP